jgi:hypothetical protein
MVFPTNLFLSLGMMAFSKRSLLVTGGQIFLFPEPHELTFA